MSATASRNAYEDCFELLDKALDSANGVRNGHRERGSAMQMFTRLHRARQIDRDQNSEVYPEGDPKHGVSEYDTLVIRSPKEEKGKWWIYIEPRAIAGVVEELGAAE